MTLLTVVGAATAEFKRIDFMIAAMIAAMFGYWRRIVWWRGNKNHSYLKRRRWR